MKRGALIFKNKKKTYDGCPLFQFAHLYIHVKCGKGVMKYFANMP